MTMWNSIESSLSSYYKQRHIRLLVSFDEAKMMLESDNNLFLGIFQPLTLFVAALHREGKRVFLPSSWQLTQAWLNLLLLIIIPL
jgi:hypothetical protein